jgi:suppressor for copper-sensitivity B
VLRYIAAIAAGNLLWEILQLPLYSLWRLSSAAYLAFAALHCWVGDMMIASVALGAAILVTGRSWPSRHYGRTAALAVLFGVAYTVFSEWLNVTVRGSWTYAPVMPRVPPLGTGLSPLLQWLVVPAAAFIWARPGNITRPRLLPVFLFLLVGLAASAGTARAAALGWVGDAHAAARLITAVDATGSSGQLDAGLQIRLAPGWHTYWRTPGDAGVPPAIDWQGSENIASAAIAWPAPTRLVVSGLQNAVYYDQVVLPIALTLAHPGAPARLHAEVDYAACAEVCVPYHANLDLTLPAGLAVPGPEAKLIADARAKVPGDFTAGQLRLAGAVAAEDKGGATLTVRLASFGAPLRAPDLFVEGVANAFPAHPDVTLADGGRTATLRVPILGMTAAKLAGTTLHVTVVDGARSAESDVTPLLGTLAPIPGATGRAAIVGLALLGGLVLNLMPCVLPVLSLKLLALVGYAGAERRVARLGLVATAAGVVASFAALAAALILLKAAGGAIGWGIQFQLPWFLAGMALLTTLFAASLWGWLSFGLPAGVAGAVGSVRGRGWFTDAFLLGAFATLLAASCSAPFVGTALGFALARGPLDIALVFAALGLGMAAPFLAVAAAPRVVAWLPRPGPWMIWLQRVLGLLLLGTAAWLLSVLALEAGPGAALVAGAALAILLAVLAWRHRRPSRRIGAGAVAVVLAAVAVLVPSLHGEAVSTDPPAPNASAGLWQPFDTDALHRAVAERKVVFVDVSAAWCLTCKLNELNVLGRAPVADRLRSSGVIAMRADWTRPDPAVTAYLQSFGRYGVPLDVVYGPGAPQGIALPELLTQGVVMEAFRRAGANHQEAAE